MKTVHNLSLSLRLVSPKTDEPATLHSSVTRLRDGYALISRIAEPKTVESADGQNLN